MKTILTAFTAIALLVLVLIVTACDSEPQRIAESVPELPTNFTITERFPTMGDHIYDIAQGDTSYGTVEQDVFSLGKKFNYLDNSRALVATAHAQVISAGAHIDVVDAKGQSIGTIQEDVFSSLFGMGITNKYSVMDSTGKTVAESDKFQLFATSFTVKDNSGNIAATLTRPMTIFNHQWIVYVNNPSTVDSRLLVMIAAFKTAEDNESDD